MTNITYPPPRPLTVGEVLDLSFRVFGATLVKCLPFAALAVLASQAANLYSIARGHKLTELLFAQVRDPGFWVVYVVGALLVGILYGAMLLRQHALITGRAPGAEFAAAGRRVFALLLLGIIFGLIGLVPFGLMAASAIGGPSAGAPLGLLLLIPACYLFVQWSCAWTALLLGGTGVIDSLARSWRLTHGGFWRLTVIYTVALIVIVVAYVLLVFLAGAVAAVFGRGDIIVFTAAYTVVVVAMGALIAPYYTALLLAVFGDLSVRKEGADLAQRIAA